MATAPATPNAEKQQADIRARVHADAAAGHRDVLKGGTLVVRPKVSAGLRVLPVVIVALAALLAFKGIGIVNSGGYSFPFGANGDAHPFANFGQLVSSWRPKPTADPIITGALGDEQKKEETPEAGAAVAEAAKPVPATGDKPAEMAEAGKPASDAAPGSPDTAASDAVAAADGQSPLAGASANPTSAPTVPLSETERALMLRLQERRETLEKRSKEIDLREGLLAAAEKRLEDRIKDLRQAETNAGEETGEAEVQPVAANGTAQPQPQPRRNEPRQAIRNLVTVYETMRPKEAARVFESLDQPVLIEVVKQMNPRKMAEIMAAMAPEAAARLTVSLANDAGNKAPRPPANDLTALPAGELPRLPQSNAPAATTPGTP